ERRRAVQVKSCDSLEFLLDLDSAFFCPAFQGSAQISRGRCKPTRHRSRYLRRIDLADEFLDRPYRGWCNREPGDAESDEGQRLEPSSPHLSTDAKLDRVADRRRHDPPQETQDGRAEPVVSLRQLGIGPIGREKKLRQVVRTDRNE